MLVNGLTQGLAPNFGDGGTMNGNLTVTGDITIQGEGALSFDEILEGTQVIDVSNSEAFLVRKNSDGGDVFTINTSTAGATLLGTLTVGVNDTGHDVTLFGATSGKKLLWDESADELVFVGSGTKLSFYDAAGGENISADASGVLSIAAGAEIDLTATAVDLNGTLDVSGNAQLSGTVTVGADGSGTDVIFYSGTAGDNFTWDASEEKLTITGSDGQVALAVADGNVTIADNLDVDGTTNLDAVDIDGSVQIDAAFTSGVDGQGYDTKFFGDTSSAYMMWDTSADDLIFVGAAGIDLEGDIDVDGTANFDIVDIDGAVDMASSLTLAGNADFNGDLDVDGTTNLDAVDIDGNVQLDGTFTVGVDGTGKDVKFFGDSASSNMLWDQSEDDLVLNDSRFLIDQDDNVSSIVINSEADSAHCVDISTPKNTTGDVIVISSIDTLTTGSAIRIDAGGTSLASTAAGGLVEISYDGAGTSANNLLYIKNDNALATSTTGILVDQDSDAHGIYIDSAASGDAALYINNSGAAPSLVATGLISAGSLDIDDVLINGSTIGHTDDTDLMTVADGVLTVAGEVDAASLDVSGNADIDGITNLDNTDIDGTLVVDGSNISLDSTSTLNIDNSNTSNGITIGTATSGVPISIGHTTSETTINDNLVVTGDLTVNGTNFVVNSTTMQVDDNMIELAHSPAGSEGNDAAVSGGGITLKSSQGDKTILWTDSSDQWHYNQGINITSGNLVVAGDIDLEGSIDVNGTANLDAVDIDGAVNMAADLTMGANILMADDTSIGISDSDERIEFDASGDISVLGANFGIGEASPDEMLHLTSGDSWKPSIKLENTNTDTTAPYIEFHKTTTNEADNDYLGVISFTGVDSNDDAERYAYIAAQALDVTDADTGGKIGFVVTADEAEKELLSLKGYNGSVVGQAEVIVNEESLDCDFRVESNDNTHMLFVDGGVNKVGVGTAAPDTTLEISTGASTTGPILRLSSTPDGSGQTAGAIEFFDLSSSENIGAKIDAYTVGASYSHDLRFWTNAATNSGTATVKMTINSAGQVGIGVTPEAWDSSVSFKALQINTTGSLSAVTDTLYLSENAYYDDTNNRWEYISSSHASQIQIGDGQVRMHTAASGSADAAITWTYSAVFDINSRISLSNNDNNTGNTVFGKSAFNAGSDNASDYNVAVGDLAMGTGSVSGAVNNVGVGYRALNALTSGDNNVCIGKDSGLQLAACADNVMVGSLTGDAMTTQSNCTLIGAYAGTLIDHNDANGTTLIGYNAGGSITQGQRNIAIGYEALDALAAGDQNVAIGHQALTAAANDEIGNICIGYLAGDSINHASADYNVFIGDQAGRGGLGAMIGCIGIGANALNSTTSNAQTGSVAIGHNALTAVTSGVGNVAVGYSAGSPVTTGSYSTAVGHESLGVSAANVITGNFNTCLGYRAGYDIEGTSESNTIVGANTGAALTTGVRNTLMGKSAGGGLTTTGNNVAIGYDALGNASNADYVIAIGNGALDALAGNSHAGEVAIGHNALGACTAGGENLAIGYSALSAMTTGGDNIAIGYNAMLTANASTADKNIAIGNYALDATSTNNSNQNVAIGHQAGTAVTTGDDNVLVGYQAGETLAAGTNNTLIGSGAAAGATGATNQTAIGKSCTAVNTDNSVTLGNADVTAVYMAQDSGATVYAAGCVIDDGNHTNIYIGGSTSTTYNVVSTNGTLGAGHVGIAGGASGDNNLYLNCATGGGFIFREQESTHMKLDTSGNLGIGDTSPDAHLDVEDATLTATADYVGIYSNHIKTGGSTDNNHAFDGIKSDMTFNDSSNSFAYLRGLQVNSVSTTTAAEESISVIGINTLAKMAGSTDVNWIKGLELMTDVDAGTVDSDVFGIDVEVDIDGGTLSGNVFGQKLNINSTVNPSGNVFGQQIFMEGSGLDASADMFLYCYDGQNSDTTAQITALAGVATFDSGDFSGAPDYAEYFESKDGNPIAIGKTVKLDGDKIVACSDGDTPMGVIRPKASSGVVCNAATMRYQGKYLKTDYDEIIMEDYEIKNWKEDISFEEYIKRGKDDTGGVLGGNVKDEKVDGSEAKDAVLDEDGNELEPAVDAVADTYFREHSYHSDRIPDGLTVPDDAKTLTPNHQRKKLNPDYDPSQEYVKRADRDEWCLVGLLGQIPITKGQPTGNWIKMKDVSDTVEMYFVK